MIQRLSASLVKMFDGSTLAQLIGKMMQGRVYASSIREANEAFASGVKEVVLTCKVIEEPVFVPQNATLKLVGLSRINMNGNVFTIVTGSKVYGDFIITSGFNPTLFYVDGTFRPTMLLADNRLAGAYGTVRGEGQDPHGTALLLDGNTRGGKRGIISWFECNLVLRNIHTGCRVQASNVSNVDGLKSYVNNNKINLAMWDVPYGYIEEDVGENAEVAANEVSIDYQSSAVSVQPVRLRGARDTVTGNLWDMDTSAYHKLNKQSVDIGGTSHKVGGRNWPSPDSNVVTINCPYVEYQGDAYGTAKTVTNNLQVFNRLGLDVMGTVGSVVGTCATTTSRITVPAGSSSLSIMARTVKIDTRRLPYYTDGYLILCNRGGTAANVQVKFGMGVDKLAASSTFNLPPYKVLKVDLTLLVASDRQAATCKDGGWYGGVDMSSLSSHELHVQVTSDKEVVVEGIVLRRSGEL